MQIPFIPRLLPPAAHPCSNSGAAAPKPAAAAAAAKPAAAKPATGPAAGGAATGGGLVRQASGGAGGGLASMEDGDLFKEKPKPKAGFKDAVPAVKKVGAAAAASGRRWALDGRPGGGQSMRIPSRPAAAVKARHGVVLPALPGASSSWLVPSLRPLSSPNQPTTRRRRSPSRRSAWSPRGAPPTRVTRRQQQQGRRRRRPAAAPPQAAPSPPPA